jgi:hypothetical protein
MAGPFTAADLAVLARPHVARAWFVRLDLPTGEWRVHSGAGRARIGGQDWQGINDPVGGVLVSIGQVEEPRFGSAVAVTLALSGANRAFLQSVHASAREIEGRAADVYWAAFDQETQAPVTGLKSLFGRGRMTSPSIHWQGRGLRTVSVTVESIWSSQNFAPGGLWNDAGQQRRFPGDKGLAFVNQKVSENWQ